jgi:hypothetical protein
MGIVSLLSFIILFIVTTSANSIVKKLFKKNYTSPSEISFN